MKILDIAFKDLTRSLRSLFAIGMTVIAPLLVTSLIYLAFGATSAGSPGLPALKVGIVNLDRAPSGANGETNLGQTIHDMFYDSRVRSWITASDYPDEASARAAVDRQQIGVAVIVPSGFTTDLVENGKTLPVAIVQDPTLTITPLVARDMVQTVLDGFLGGGIALGTIGQREESLGISMTPAQQSSLTQEYGEWYVGFQQDLLDRPDLAVLAMVAPAAGRTSAANPTRSLMGLVMSGMMVFFAFFTGAYSMSSILREQEEGTLARLFTTSTSRTSILAGKFLAVILMVILQGLVLMIAAHFAFGVNWGDPRGAALALVGQVVAAAGLGVLLISFIRNSKQMGPVLGGGLTVLSMLGGLFTVAVPNVPETFNLVSQFTPQGWVIKLWHIVLSGQPTADLLSPLAVTVGLGVAMFVLGAAVFRRRFA